MPEVLNANSNRAVTEHTLSLLWEACRREPDVAAINAAAAGDVQPSVLVLLALGNRIGPLLWRSLVAAGCEDALGSERSRLEGLANLYVLQELVLFPRAVALAVGTLVAAGLEPVVMKGPAVSRAYPGPGLRPMDDLDLLLPRQRHNDAVRALEGAGWEVSRSQARDLYDTQLRHPELPSLPLELHYALEGWHERSNRLDPLWLWQRRVPFDCMGTPAFGLPLEEEVLSLAAHAGKPYHRFDRLLWLADLAMVIGRAAEQGHPIDWDRLEDMARRTQCVTVVSAGLRMATRMGLSLPDERFGLPETGWRSVPLRRLLQLDWPVAAHDKGTYHFRFALVDSSWRRLAPIGAAPYNSSGSERVHLPGRAAARAVELWRTSRATSARSRGMNT